MGSVRRSVAAFGLALSILAVAAEVVLGQEGTRTLAADAFGNPAATWFDPKVCKRSSGGTISLKAGSATLNVPLQIVRGASPGKIERMTKTADGRLSLEVARNIGCPEAPLSIATVTLSPVPLDGGAIIVSWSPENRAVLEGQLTQIRDSGTCPARGPGLIYCEGSASGAARERVAFIIAADPKLTQASGGPLRARCLIRDDGSFCTVIDDLPGEVRYQAPLAERPTLASIIAAHRKARSYVDGLRAKGPSGLSGVTRPGGPAATVPHIVKTPARPPR